MGAENQTDVQFFWYREDTEIFSARSLQEFQEYIRSLMRGIEEVSDFTEANKGDIWGEADPDTLVFDEEVGTHFSLSELASTHDGPSVPNQVATTYN